MDITTILLLIKFLLIMVIIFMFYKYKETDYEKLRIKNYRITIACLLIVITEILSGNDVGAGIWLFNAGIFQI